MLNLIVVKFLSSFDCYAVNSGYKQIKGRFVQQKFFKQQLSSVNFVSAVFRQQFDDFFFDKRVKLFAIFSIATKTTHPGCQGVSITVRFSVAYPVPLTLFYRISPTSSKSGQPHTVMKKQSGNLSQSEKEKYFE